MKIQYQELANTIEKVLMQYNVAQQTARETAEVLAYNTADGIASHGVNRLPRLVSYLKNGYISGKLAHCVQASGTIERWDGEMGMGVSNALLCTRRACALARQQGIGVVALRNTNHWMRAGYYGWMAAEEGMMSILWTNTMANMPPWGAKDCRIGNNPLVLAVPRTNGQHVVTDCALSQFSYGKIEEYRLLGKQLPVPGGFDENGQITTDPAAIEKTWQVLPAGFWKGSCLSMVFDMIGTILADGNAVCDIARKYPDELGLTQVFMMINPDWAGSEGIADAVANRVIADLAEATPITPGQSIRYPGQSVYDKRRRSMAEGIEVLDSVWAQIAALQNEDGVSQK